MSERVDIMFTRSYNKYCWADQQSEQPTDIKFFGHNATREGLRRIALVLPPNRACMHQVVLINVIDCSEQLLLVCA